MILSDYSGVIISFVFLCISGFFSFAEACLLSCDYRKIFRESESKNKKALRVLEILNNKNILISNILFLATLSDVFLSSILTVEKTKHFGDEHIVVFGLLITALILIFGEVLPKAFALINPEASAKSISLPILWSIKLFYPVTFLIQKCVNFIFFIFRIKTQAEEPSLIRDIKDLVSAHKHRSPIKGFETSSYTMISGISIIEDMRVSQIMVHRKNVAMIDIAGKGVDEILREVVEKQHSRIPIYENDIDNIIGVINVRDLLNHVIFGKDRDLSKEEFLSLCIKPVFIHENTLLLNQLNYFRANHRHIAIVVDEYAVFLGIVTMEDIIEKIVGSIYDEDEEREAFPLDIITQRNGDLLVKGDVLLFHLIHKHHISVREGDHYPGTLAGFIIDKIERIPHENEEIVIGDHRFTIKKMQKNVIQWVVIKSNKNA